MLFYAILYSDCIHSLNPVVQSNVDDLRKFRNEEFAHMAQGHLTDAEFQNAISKVDVAFQALGLSTVKIQEIKSQTSVPTEEIRDVLKKVNDLKQEVQILEDLLNKDVSSFCILPPKPPHNVAPRNSEVADITEQLRELKKANENSLSYLYISGNPGSGKSQLAGLVAKQFFDEVKENLSATSFVMTVNAESPKTLLESYVSFARHLKCPEYAITNTHNSNDLNTDEKITNLKTLISTKVDSYTSWLLVVDNVTCISNVHAHLPEPGSKQWSKGQLLITTQDIASIPQTSSFLQHISVSSGMEPRDASCLLSMLSGFTDSEMEKEVAQALDHQPLALASAATYVKQVRKNKLTLNFGWNDYLNKLENGQRGATETIHAQANPSYKKSMTKAITLAVEEVMASDKVIYHTFTLLSLCAAQPLSLEIVINYILNIDEKIEDKEAISMRIQRCSLLLSEEEVSSVCIRVHQVVHEAIHTVMKDLPEIQRIQAVNGAIKSFSQFIKDELTTDCDKLDYPFTKKHIVCHLKPLIIKIEGLFSEEGLIEVIQSDTSSKSYAKDLEKLGRICADDSEFYVAKKYYNLALETILFSEACSDSDVAQLCVSIGNLNSDLSDLHQAKENYEFALSIFLKKSGPGHVDVATVYNNLGTVHNELGDLEQAKEYHDRALAIRLKKLGPDHVDVAKTYNNLGSVHSDLGDLEQAKEYYDCALAIRLKKLGPDNVDVARTYNNLGSVRSDLGDLEQAKEYYDRALAIRLKKLGPDHVDVATVYNNLGTVHNDLGDLEQAKEYHDRALAIRLKKLGPYHVDVARTYNNLGSVHSDLGDLEQAKAYYDRALAITLKTPSPDLVDVARTYNNLGSVHSNLGDLEQAKEYYDRALAILLKKLGPDHTDVARAYNNLGSVHSDLGDLEQAKEYHDRALAIRLKKLDPDHVDVASTYNNLGIVHRKVGDLEQAKEYHDRALAIRLKKLGPDHVDVARTYNNLGSVHSDLGDLEQAKEYHDRALAIRLKKLDPDHVDVASTYNNLGIVHRKVGDLEQAKEYYDRALAIRLKKLGPDHTDVARTYNNLGSVHSTLGDLEQAKEYYDRALAIRLKKLSPDHIDVASTYNNLGIVHRKVGDLEQSKEYYDRALVIFLKRLGPDHYRVSTVQRNLAELQQLELMRNVFQPLAVNGVNAQFSRS